MNGLLAPPGCRTCGPVGGVQLQVACGHSLPDCESMEAVKLCTIMCKNVCDDHQSQAVLNVSMKLVGNFEICVTHILLGAETIVGKQL